MVWRDGLRSVFRSPFHRDEEASCRFICSFGAWKTALGNPLERRNTKGELDLGRLRCSTHWMIQSNWKEHLKIISYRESLQINKKTMSIKNSLCHIDKWKNKKTVDRQVHIIFHLGKRSICECICRILIVVIIGWYHSGLIFLPRKIVIINKILKYLCKKGSVCCSLFYPQCLDCTSESLKRIYELYGFLSLAPGDTDSAELVGDETTEIGGSRFWLSHTTECYQNHHFLYKLQVPCIMEQNLYSSWKLSLQTFLRALLK